MASRLRSRSDLLLAVRRARVAGGALALRYTGGAGYAAKTAGATILIDPFVGPSSPPDWIRAVPPAFNPTRIADLGPLDAVLLTHEHADRADPAALAPIGKRTGALASGPTTCVAVARWAGFSAERCRLLRHDQTLTVGDVRLTAVAMLDPLAEGCNGYVLETGRVAVLHRGDGLHSLGFVELEQRWALDATCVSVGSSPPGRTDLVDEADVARAARDAGASILIVRHHDRWQGMTLDPWRVSIAAHWYAPSLRVVPARTGRRVTIPAAPGGPRTSGGDEPFVVLRKPNRR